MPQILAGSLEIESHVMMRESIWLYLQGPCFSNKIDHRLTDKEIFFETVVEHYFLSFDQVMCSCSDLFIVVSQLRVDKFQQFWVTNGAIFL